MEPSAWADFVQACRYWRSRLIRPDQIGRWLLMLVVLQLCLTPLTMDLGLTLYSLGADTTLMLLDMQMALLLGLLWNQLGALRQAFTARRLR